MTQLSRGTAFKNVVPSQGWGPLKKYQTIRLGDGGLCVVNRTWEKAFENIKKKFFFGGDLSTMRALEQKAAGRGDRGGEKG